MFRLDVDTKKRGAIFDGSAKRILDRATENAGEKVANYAEDQVQRRLAHVLRHPTGRYQSRIHTTGSGSMHEVTDGGIIYGPWLEGVGSRNRTTRFKGYFTFRIVGQQVDRRAERLSEPVIDRAARRL